MSISKNLKIIFTSIISLSIPFLVSAQAAIDKLKKVGESGGFETTSSNEDGTILAETLGRIVSAFLSLLGVIFIILILLAGYNWMTAAGDEEKVTRAKDTLRRAIIGLIIIVSAWGIWVFINTYVFNREGS
jgi:cytochrome bd-type quinol oxidase subunit 2